MLYLPPYSPDLNQIEQAIAKLKQPLRAAAFQLLGNVADPGIYNLPTLTPVTPQCESFDQSIAIGWVWPEAGLLLIAAAPGSVDARRKAKSGWQISK